MFKNVHEFDLSGLPVSLTSNSRKYNPNAMKFLIVIQYNYGTFGIENEVYNNICRNAQKILYNTVNRKKSFAVYFNSVKLIKNK